MKHNIIDGRLYPTPLFVTSHFSIFFCFRWADITAQSTLPVPLILTSVQFSSLVVNDPEKNYLSAPVTIAHVLPTPIIFPNEQNPIFQTQTSQLILRGKGLKGCANPVTLFFRPSLQRGVIYDDVSSYPLASNEVILQLKPNQKWRSTPGILYLIGIDTGGGHIQLTHHATPTPNNNSNHHGTFHSGGLVVAEVRVDIPKPSADIPKPSVRGSSSTNIPITPTPTEPVTPTTPDFGKTR